eukprot:4807558-Ditylum_brightwellii.AAC.1
MMLSLLLLRNNECHTVAGAARVLSAVLPGFAEQQNYYLAQPEPSFHLVPKARYTCATLTLLIVAQRPFTPHHGWRS